MCVCLRGLLLTPPVSAVFAFRRSRWPDASSRGAKRNPAVGVGSLGRGLLRIKPSAPGVEAETLGSGPAFKPGSDAALVPGCPAPQPPNRAILGGSARAGLACLLGGRSQQLSPGFPVACGVVTGVDPALFSFSCLAANLEGVSTTFFI